MYERFEHVSCDLEEELHKHTLLGSEDIDDVPGEIKSEKYTYIVDCSRKERNHGCHD